MKLLSRIMYWLAYSVILAFMPVFIGFLSARIFQYEFNAVDAIADLLITDFCLAATVLRDTIEGKDRIVSRIIIFLMLMTCFTSSVFFGHIMMLDGQGQQISGETVRYLTRLVVILLSETAFFGFLTQAFLKKSP